MYYPDTETIIPKYALEPDPSNRNQLFKIHKIDGGIGTMRADFLVPHRKDYYFFVLVRQGSSRHWIDMTPYTLKPDTFYFTVPHQVHLKEEAKPLKGVFIGFTAEFLALEGNHFLKQLPIIQNPHNGHELSLHTTDILYLEDTLDRIYAEYQTKNNWQHGMLMAHMHVLLIYLSRLYTAQFNHTELAPDRVLLKKYLAKIEESYTALHDVTAYAGLLNISAGHLSEVVKRQSGKPAITHIHERLILEAKRLLFHTEHPIKEITFELGFKDTSYFNRFFKRLTKLTPIEYRQSIREMYH
ncbi:MAG TPA: helix-turn-helix transcriptional regulator [Puia sp.]|nr:helix-turn-helix transcriptional regulator [Puia sp.]